jgi:hypothetical protein
MFGSEAASVRPMIPITIMSSMTVKPACFDRCISVLQYVLARDAASSVPAVVTARCGGTAADCCGDSENRVIARARIAARETDVTVR